jgi:hypothetical protein
MVSLVRCVRDFACTRHNIFSNAQSCVLLAMMASSSSAIKIVSFNTYLISQQFNLGRETFPSQRATKIREFVKGKQLCFLQEVWGAGLAELTIRNSKDQDKFSIPPYRYPWTIFGHGSGRLFEVLNTTYLHFQKTGGLYDFSDPIYECRYRKKHTFTKSRSNSLKGVEATMWSIPQWEGGNKRVLVFNTHLDPWNSLNRRHQINEILEFFQETLATIEKESSQSGQPDWTQTGVLVLGDFNIKADSEEYWQELIKHDGWRDFFQGENQHSYALENSLVSYPEDCGRIDYIFGIDHFGSRKFMKLEAVSRSIHKEAVGMESSDHYPLIVELLPS